MKKILASVLIIMMCLTSAIALSGCKEEKKGRIEFSNIQEISISIEESIDVNAVQIAEENFLKQVKVTVYSHSNEVLLENMSVYEAMQTLSAQLTNFKLDSAGKRVAQFSVCGETGSFEYEVVIY